MAVNQGVTSQESCWEVMQPQVDQVHSRLQIPVEEINDSKTVNHTIICKVHM